MADDLLRFSYIYISLSRSITKIGASVLYFLNAFYKSYGIDDSFRSGSVQRNCTERIVNEKIVPRL